MQWITAQVAPWEIAPASKKAMVEILSVKPNVEFQSLDLFGGGRYFTLAELVANVSDAKVELRYGRNGEKVMVIDAKTGKVS